MHPYGKEWLLHIKLHLLTVLFCILGKGVKLLAILRAESVKQSKTFLKYCLWISYQLNQLNSK